MNNKERQKINMIKKLLLTLAITFSITSQAEIYELHKHLKYENCSDFIISKPQALQMCFITASWTSLNTCINTVYEELMDESSIFIVYTDLSTLSLHLDKKNKVCEISFHTSDKDANFELFKSCIDMFLSKDMIKELKIDDSEVYK